MSEQFTKEQLAEIVLWWANDADDEECPVNIDDWDTNSIKTVEIGEDVVEHKAVYNSNIYQVEGVYFEVTFTRDNCGYWGDGEHYAPTVQEVFPKEITKIIWVNKKP